MMKSRNLWTTGTLCLAAVTVLVILPSSSIAYDIQAINNGQYFRGCLGSDPISSSVLFRT